MGKSLKGSIFNVKIIATNINMNNLWDDFVAGREDTNNHYYYYYETKQD